MWDIPNRVKKETTKNNKPQNAVEKYTNRLLVKIILNKIKRGEVK